MFYYLGERHYKVGEAAKICKASQSSIQKWFDRGLLKGFRLPLSKNDALNDKYPERRIPRSSLDTFMNNRGGQ